uniref:Uncharacterized protein n=1 Tax=Acrobeloides nanus TaxID=290746 RepID=A0A914CAN7_9BILA
MTITQETAQNSSLKVENYDQFVNNFINEVSIDLIQASINEAHFLKYAEDPDLDILPPLDVHFIWHTHMLRPLEYRKDCIEMVGKIVDHKSFTKEELVDKNRRKVAMEAWNKFDPNKTYDFGLVEHHDYEMKSSYDLLSAAFRQQQFMKKIITMECFFHENDIRQAVSRYQKFLFILKNTNGYNCVPTIDIDLVWHAHQLHPLGYAIDCKKIVEKIINHDDSVRELSHKAAETEMLWKKFGLGDYKIPTHETMTPDCDVSTRKRSSLY